MKNGIKKVVPDNLECSTVSKSNGRVPHSIENRRIEKRRVEQTYDGLRYEAGRSHGVDRRAVDARRFSEQTYATEFPRYQKILLAVMTALVLIVAASNSHATESAVAFDTAASVGANPNVIYKTVGADGEVSFNNIGEGVPVALAPSRVISAAERQDQQARQAEIVALADRLASERRARSRHRSELALRANAAAAVDDRQFNDDRFLAGNRFGFFGNVLGNRGFAGNRFGSQFGAGPLRNRFAGNGPVGPVFGNRGSAAPRAGGRKAPVTHSRVLRSRSFGG